MNSPIQPYSLRFHKNIESGKYLIIPFTTLIFDYQFRLVFTDNTYYFSITGHDLLEITDHERQDVVLKLCRGIYTSKTEAHALLLQIEYYFTHKQNIQFLPLSAFDGMVSESYVGKWIGDQIHKIMGYGMKNEYEKWVAEWIRSKA